ncbi:MAG TPA: hypothetical protein PK548_04100, partial [Bacteroidales bacterium]|nr:hypothetical protein [Bacteroidales bacterium]
IKRKVVFIYAIRDDIFENKLDRVKFFDFIIPIIPFINPTNANEQLTSLIKSKSLSNELSKNFTYDLVSYIDDIDMRLLVNIFNEYLIYKGNLKENRLVQENLFSIITYKNMFPEDFGKLQKREGVLYEFICSKPLYIEETIREIDNKIEKIQEEIKIIEKESLMSIRELRSIYLMAFKSLFPEALSFFFDEKKILFKDMLNDENFQKFQSANDIKYVQVEYDARSGQYWINENVSSSKNFDSIEAQVNKNLTYSERLKNIENKSNDKVNVLRIDIENLKKQKIEINSWDLKNILNKISLEKIVQNLSNNNDKIFKKNLDEIIIKNNLMRYILWNGYINESYYDYITLFHGINMTAQDLTFIRKVKIGEILHFDYEITNLSDIVNKLELRYFLFEPILNFNLVEFILSDPKKYDNKLANIMELLSNEKDISVEFIDEFIERNSINVGIFIKKLCNKWMNFWNYIENKSNYTKEKKNNYLRLIIQHANLQDIENLNKIGKLSESIENTSLFLNLFNESYYNKLELVIKQLNIKFTVLEKPTDNSSRIFQFIYNNNYYKINEKNISFFLNIFSNLKDIKSPNYSNYTIINNSNCNNLKKYIEGNIEEYVKNVFLKLPSNTSEHEEDFVKLLNNKNLTEELKKEIIKKEKTIIKDLNKLDSTSIQKITFQENKIHPSWENVILYYNNVNSNFDDTLIGFLNSKNNYNVLSKKEFITNNNTNFSSDLILCNELSLEAYKKLVGFIPYPSKPFSIKNLDKNKIEWLVESQKLILSPKNYQNLKNNFPNLHISLIESNPDIFNNIFLENFNSYSINDNDLLLLFASSKLSQTNKLLLVPFVPHESIEEIPALGERLCNILSNSRKLQLDNQFIERLIMQSKSIEDKIKLLNIYIDNFKISEIKNIITNLDKPYPNVLLRQHKPKFPNNKYNRIFLDKLKLKGVIKNYNVIDKKNIKVIANY